MALSEDAIHRAILAYLRAALVGPVCGPIHVPNGGNRDAVTGAKLKGLGALAGAPDLMWWSRDGCFALEVKTAKGRLSASQEAFREAFENVGGRYAVVRSVDDARAALMAWGVPTRERRDFRLAAGSVSEHG